MKIVSLLFVFLLFSYSESYRILGLCPMNGKSHFLMFERLFKELAARGHEVDVLSHFPQNKKIPRYNDISVKGSMPNVVGNFSFDLVKETKSLKRGMEMLVYLCGTDACKAVFNHPETKKLKNTDVKYDAIITEIFGTDCMFGFAHLFNVPVITMTTSVNLPWGDSRFGNPYDPTYIPNYFAPYLPKMTLVEKFWNFWYNLYTELYYFFHSIPASDVFIKDFFGDETPHVSQLIKEYSSLHLVNSHFSINQARPWVPNVIEVGGLHINESKQLSQHYNNVLSLENKYKGVVYFSFGSLLTIHSFPLKFLEIIFETFEFFTDYKFLVKGNQSLLPDSIKVSSNVHFESWTPQMEILCHPNVKLFISHGGLMGTHETVYCGVPVLEIPVFADQLLNSKHLADKGMAIVLNLNELSKKDMLSSVRELLELPKYAIAAENISKQFKDRPMSAIDTAVYWIEYVVRHNGAKQMKSVLMTSSFVEFYALDVILCILVFAYSLYFLLKRY